MKLDLHSPGADTLQKMQREFEEKIINDILEGIIEHGLNKKIIDESFEFKNNFLMKCKLIVVEVTTSFFNDPYDYKFKIKVNEEVWREYWVVREISLENHEASYTQTTHSFNHVGGTSELIENIEYLNIKYEQLKEKK
ncbi:MAG: hypothetical protein ACRDDY_10755 [Clostridium sp.]|uniref:hypothetical protein n=1 Tax=Clostridium sp. TaxID=1506 RepID=UPI003EE4CACF